MSLERLKERSPRLRSWTTVVLVVLFLFVAQFIYSITWIVQRDDFLEERNGIYDAMYVNTPAVDPPWPLGMYGEKGVPILETWPEHNLPADLERAKSLFPESRFSPRYNDLVAYKEAITTTDCLTYGWLSRKWFKLKTNFKSLVP